MLPKGFTDKIRESVAKPCFWKWPSPDQDWKSKSMRIIPEEFVGNTPGAFEHRVVLSVPWGNSWQLWLERDKDNLFMIEEDWNEFVDDNHLGPNDNLFFRHDDTMYLEVQIFKNNGEEIIDVPGEVEPETEPHLPNPQNSHTATASSYPASASEFSASGVASGQPRQGQADILNHPERYLLNPENPYFVKTVAKKNDVLYVRKTIIQKYGLEFGPVNSPASYILPEEEISCQNRFYSNTPCFSGWGSICRKYNLKEGDKVVCELERLGGLVRAVRLHFVN